MPTSSAYQWVTHSAKMALKKAQVEVPVESAQESNDKPELGLREKKKKNIIVFGVPEPKSSKAEEQRSDDKKAIQQIFTALGVMDKGAVSYRRFKKTSDRVPPILIMMQDVKSLLEVLTAAKKLSKVYLNADMTETERREDRNPVRLPRQMSRYSSPNLVLCRSVFDSLSKPTHRINSNNIRINYYEDIISNIDNDINTNTIEVTSEDNNSNINIYINRRNC